MRIHVCDRIAAHEVGETSPVLPLSTASITGPWTYPLKLQRFAGKPGANGIAGPPITGTLRVATAAQGLSRPG